MVDQAGKTLLIFPPSFEPNEAPPLGIAFIAGCLRRAGHEVELLDLTVTPHIIPDWNRYTLIGMSLLCVNFQQGVMLARKIRQQNKDVRIVAGGPFADTNTREVLETGLFDAVVHGEGENVFVPLIEQLKNGGDFFDVKGLSFRENGKILRTKSLPQIENLDSLPFPAYDLLPMKKYCEWSLIASRGCPYRCIFCNRGPTESQKTRRLSPERVLEWMSLLMKDFGHNRILFVDSTFTSDQEWVKTLCDLIVKNGARFRWSCQTRADCISGVLLEKMKAAGCELITMGAESGNNEILGLLRKDFSKSDIWNTVRLFKETKAPRLLLNFIIGHPWDTEETVRETAEFAQELRTRFGARYRFFLLVPFPGTELWDNAEKYGLKITGRWEGFRKYSFMGSASRINANFSTRNFSVEELTRLYHRLTKSRFSFATGLAKQARKRLFQLSGF